MKPEQIRLNAEIEDRHWWFAARRRIVGDLVRVVAPPSKDTLVLDIGCGTGGNSGYLSREYSVIGIDASEEAIRLSRRRFPGIEFRHGVVDDCVPPLAGRARVYLLMDVLEHVEDDFKVFSTVCHHAQPGSIFLVTVPAHPELWSLHDEASLHYRRYEMERLRKAWAGLPVRERLVTFYNSRLFPIVRGVRVLNSRLGRTSGKASTDMWIPNALLNRTLERIFAGESRRLCSALDRSNGSIYANGVSILAVLERVAGASLIRARPAGTLPDAHRPRWIEELGPTSV